MGDAIAKLILNASGGSGVGTSLLDTGNGDATASSSKSKKAIWDEQPRNVDTSGVSVHEAARVSPNWNGSCSVFG